MIADIAGPCALEVKEALMRRFIDNSKYHVVSRDNLDQIIGESDRTYGEGRFNTRTAAKLGELLGASMFIVGRIAYCDKTSGTGTEDAAYQFNLLAGLQIIDLETGAVILSTASEGMWTPKQNASLEDSAERIEQYRKAKSQYSRVSVASEDFQLADSAGGIPSTELSTAISTRFTLGDSAEADDDPEARPVNYPALRAAEDMADRFADKFFSRPTWEVVQMWTSPEWRFGESLHFVQLGRCPQAVKLIEAVASSQVSFMSEEDISRYLHNYGVALLCAGDPLKATKKLRSAYRIRDRASTLKMLDLAARLLEWSLEVEIDTQPEVDILLRESTTVSMLE